MLLALVCAAVAAAQIPLERHYQAACTAHQVRWERTEAADRAAADQAQRLYLQLRRARPGYPQPSMDDAVRQLNGGSPFPLLTESGRSNPLFVDPATGGQAVLQQQSQTWTGVDSTYFVGTYPYDSRVGLTPDPNRGWYGAVSIGRRVACVLMYAAWALLLVLTLANGGTSTAERVGRALTLLEVAAVATFFAFLGPRYLLAWNQVTQDDSPGIGLLEITFSVVLLIVLFRNAKRGDGIRRCRACGYDLTGNRSGVCPECGTATGARALLVT